jgi:hypothetical protein
MGTWVDLNSQRYLVRGDIQRYKVDPLAPVVRQSGRQRLDSLTSRQSFIYPAPNFGIGMRRIRSDKIDDPMMARRSWDSEIDTRFEDATLAILNESSTAPTLSNSTVQAIRRSVEFEGNLWGFFEATVDSDGSGQILSRKYTGSSTAWTNGGTVATAVDATSYLNVMDVGVVQDVGVILFKGKYDSGDTTSSFDVFHSDDFASWTNASTNISDVSATAAANGANLQDGKLVTIGGDIYAILIDANNQVRVWVSTNKGVAWTQKSAVVTGDRINGAVAYYDLNGDEAPIFCTRDSVYAYDTSANAFHILVRLMPDDNNGLGFTVWSNPFAPAQSLYCSTGDGDIIEYTWLGTSSGSIIRNVGPTKDDGLPTAKQGYVHRMVGSTRWLFYSYGGHAASKNATILAFDGKGHKIEFDGSGNHFMHKNSTANRAIDWVALSNADDGNLRLHFQERTAATTGVTKFLAEPLVSPASGVAKKYMATGVIDRPETDFGLPRDDAAFIGVFYQARDLGTTDEEYMNIDYGVNGATPSTDFGNIVDGTQEVTLASGAGVSGKSIQLRENWNRSSGDTSKTPQANSLEIMYRKKIATLRGWRFTVDVANMAVEQQTPIATVIAALETAEANVPLQAFEDLPGGTTYYVDVTILGWLDEHGRSVSVYEDAEPNISAVQLQLQEVL